jgi:hypothetical protein
MNFGGRRIGIGAIAGIARGAIAVGGEVGIAPIGIGWGAIRKIGVMDTVDGAVDAAVETAVETAVGGLGAASAITSQ